MRRLRLRLPAALVRLHTADAGWRDEATERAAEDGALALRSGLLASVPTQGDPAVVEAALAIAHQILAEHRPDDLVILVFPGLVETGDEGAREVRTPLIDDLEAQGPRVAPGQVYLTSHASWELESGWRLESAGAYRGPSGRELPLWKLVTPAERQPWRNPTLLGAARRRVERPELEDTVDGLRTGPGLVLTGPMGCGKTRLAHLAIRGEIALWARPWSRRSGGPSLASQLLDQIVHPVEGARPLVERADPPPRSAGWWDPARVGSEDEALALLRDLLASHRLPSTVQIVIEDAERLDGSGRRLVRELLRHQRLGDGLRVVVTTRGASGYDAWDLPEVRVGRFKNDEMTQLGMSLLDDLSMPPQVRAALLDASRGIPFALEESLVQLTRSKVVRRVYGNFFFSGGDLEDPEPSPRLIRHLEAECGRLGNSTPLRVMAHLESGIPIEELTESALGLAPDLPRDWYERYLEAELVDIEAAGLDQILNHACPLYRRAMNDSIPASSAESVRHLIGRQLAALGPGEDRWQAYALLAGTAEAIPVLLELARHPPPETPSGALFASLADELQAHREREGSEDLEMALLWQILPLARRTGKLHRLGDAIERALELSEGHPARRLALIALRAEKLLNDGRPRDAEVSLLEALEIAQETGDKRKAQLFVQLGKVLQRQHRYPEARKLFERLLPALDDETSRALEATCTFHLGNIALYERRLETALSLHRDSLNLRRELGLDKQIGSSLSALGTVHLELGDYPRALKTYQQAEEVLDLHGREGEVSYALLGQGRSLSRLGDYTAASHPFKRALEERSQRDDRMGEAIARLIVADNQLNLRQLDTALEEAKRAHYALTLTEATRQLGLAERLLGRIALGQRRYDDARQHLETAVNLHQRHGDIMAATFDRAWLLEASLAIADHRRIEELCSALEAVLETLRYPEGGEILDLRLHQGLEWLRQRGRDVDPEVSLRRAYGELMRKTEMLDADLRSPFLYQVADNRAILEAATRLAVDGS